MNIKASFSSILSPLKKVSKPYKLISKTTNIKIDSSANLSPRLSIDVAQTADVVVIAKSQNEQMQKKITTFRDVNGKPVEIVFEYLGFDLPTVHKLFKKIETYSLTKGRLIQTFVDLNYKNKTKIWKKISTEQQFVRNLSEDNNKKIVTIVKISTEERALADAKKETHTFHRYLPLTQGKSVESKYLKLEIEKDDYGIPHVVDMNHSKNVKIPLDDEYLAFRAYDYEDIKKPITYLALKKNKLLNLDIGVNTSYTLPDDIAGDFSFRTGDIQFNNRVTLKQDLIDTAFHEVHHALQYAIMSLFEKIQTAYGRKCFEKFKCFRSSELRQKADEYFIAHLAYDNKNPEKYANNLLEMEARTVAHHEVLKYMDKGKDLALQFNIPIFAT